MDTRSNETDEIVKSIAQIKKNLKEFQQDVLDKISQHAKLRKGVPPDLTKAVLAAWNRKCAICQRKVIFKHDDKMARKSPVMAHVVPVEEGGKLYPIEKDGKLVGSANLLPLCERKYKSLHQAIGKGKTIENVGCHKLYDEEGAWTRQQMMQLLQTHDTGQAEVHRPCKPKQVFQPDEIDKLLEDAEEKINRPSKAGVRDPLGKIKEKLKEYEAQSADWSKLLKLAVGGFRLARRPYPTKNQQQSLKDVHWFDQKVKTITRQATNPKDQLIINYERGMVSFEFRDFEEAQRLMRKDFKFLKKCDDGWAINDVQACVCDFELARKKGLSHSIKKATGQLENLMPQLKKLAEIPNAPPAHKTWPVTAWLHIARMKAYLDDKTALAAVKEAEDIRDNQLNAKVWEYSSGKKSKQYKQLMARSGWSRYTQVLLLHAKAESLRAYAEATKSPKAYCEAVKFLALAARRIIIDQYKHYEYLDNVLEGLQKIPREICGELDKSRKKLEDSRNDLKKLYGLLDPA